MTDVATHMARYRAYATGRAIPAGMNYLTDLIVRPGIRKFLWPLLLYRGHMDPGHAHRLWNMALLMMASEAETLSDGIKIANNPAFSQLCGPVKAPIKTTMMSFFGRLWNSPDVTDNIPGFTEYVKSMQLGPCWLTPVALETGEQFCAPWRKSTHPDFDPQAERPEYGTRALYYPYIVHEAGVSGEHDLVRLVNQLVPAYLPDQLRADACQDLVVSLLAGDLTVDNAPDWVEEYVRRVFRMHPQKWDKTGRATSFSQPVPGTLDMPWTEII